MNNSQDSQRLGEKVVSDIQKDFKLVGAQRVHSWYAWAIVGIVFGMALGIVYVANRSAQFDSSQAAEDMTYREEALSFENNSDQFLDSIEASATRAPGGVRPGGAKGGARDHNVEISATWPPSHTASSSASWPTDHIYSISVKWQKPSWHNATRSSAYPANHLWSVSITWPADHIFSRSILWPAQHRAEISSTWPTAQKKTSTWPANHTLQISKSWPSGAGARDTAHGVFTSEMKKLDGTKLDRDKWPPNHSSYVSDYGWQRDMMPNSVEHGQMFMTFLVQKVGNLTNTTRNTAKQGASKL